MADSSIYSEPFELRCYVICPNTTAMLEASRVECALARTFEPVEEECPRGCGVRGRIDSGNRAGVGRISAQSAIRLQAS